MTVIVYGCCSVRPFLSDKDYQKTEKIVHEFEQGIGRELHDQLLELAKIKRNWVRLIILVFNSRSSYASVVLGIVILSVCPFVRLS